MRPEIEKKDEDSPSKARQMLDYMVATRDATVAKVRDMKSPRSKTGDAAKKGTAASAAGILTFQMFVTHSVKKQFRLRSDHFQCA